MGGKTKSTSTSTQTAAPPSWTAGGLSAIGDRVTQAVQGAPVAKYGGDFIAQPGADAWNIPGMYGAAGATAGQLAQQAQGMIPGLQQGINFAGPGEATAQGFGSYDASAIQPVIQAAIQPIMRQLTEQVLPGMRSAGIESGAYGGTRSMETLPALAMRDANEAAMGLGTQLAFQDHNAQQQRLLEAFGLNTQRGLGAGQLETQRMGMVPEFMDTVMRMQAGGADLAAQGAGFDQQLRQMEIDNALRRHQYDVAYPYQGLDIASGLLGQVGNPWGTTTGTQTQTQQTGGLAPIVGGLMGLGGMALGFPGVSNLFGGAAKTAAGPAVAGGWWNQPRPNPFG